MKEYADIRQRSVNLKLRCGNVYSSSEVGTTVMPHGTTVTVDASITRCDHSQATPPSITSFWYYKMTASNEWKNKHG